MRIANVELPLWIPKLDSARVRVCPTPACFEIDRAKIKAYRGEECHSRAALQLTYGNNRVKATAKLADEFPITTFQRSTLSFLNVPIGQPFGYVKVRRDDVPIWAVNVKIVLQLFGIDQTILYWRPAIFAWDLDFSVLGNRGFFDQFDVQALRGRSRISPRPRTEVCFAEFHVD